MDVLLALVGRAAKLGWHRLDLLLLLGFHCILRTAAMYSLRVGDLEFDQKLQRGILTLRESKSGARYNMVESVTIGDADLVMVCRALLANAPAGELIFLKVRIASDDVLTSWLTTSDCRSRCTTNLIRLGGARPQPTFYRMASCPVHV